MSAKANRKPTTQPKTASRLSVLTRASALAKRPGTCLAPRPHGWFLHYRALRNHDIAAGWRDRCGEAGATKTPRIADAGCAAEQIIGHQNSNKADKASGSTSPSRSRCTRGGRDDRRLRRRRRIPSGCSGWKRCSQSESAYHRCGGRRNIPLVVLCRLMTERLTTWDFMGESPKNFS
jgi:hypothetical protein